MKRVAFSWHAEWPALGSAETSAFSVLVWASLRITDVGLLEGCTTLKTPNPVTVTCPVIKGPGPWCRSSVAPTTTAATSRREKSQLAAL